MQSKDKKTKKSLARIALVLYLTVAVTALVATVGWFTLNNHVFIENEKEGTVQIEVSTGDLKISLDNENYGDRLSLDKPTNYYIDISGNGETLYYPKSLDVNDEPYLNDVTTFVDVTGQPNYYIELKVYFQTTATMEVYLSSDSEVVGLEKYVNAAGAQAFARKSMFGTFSCDAIVGAARVAFLSVDGTDGDGKDILTLKNVWIPNDDICLSYSGTNSASLTTGNNVRESLSGYGYLEKNEDATQMVEKQYTSADYAAGDVSVRREELADATTQTINQAKPLLSFTEKGVLETKALVIRLWFEGTDREADKALNGGMAKYSFNFIGINKSDPEKTLADAETVEAGTLGENEIGIYYNVERSALCYYDPDTYQQNSAEKVGGNQIVYSLDGINWSAFDSTGNGKLTRKKEAYEIYVRTAETGGQKPGNVVSVVIPKK